ncbi:iron export ABC transporter permease subunit FetB [Desulfatiferula olefinivorans]
MTHQLVDIGPLQLAVGLVFVLISGLASVAYSLKLEKDLLIGTVRTFVQLFALGYVLKFVFALSSMALVLGVFGFMILFAAWTIYSRVKDRQIPFFLPVFFSMLLSFSLVSFVVTAVVVGVKPWWEPRYFIPLGGMVIGNSMNAIAIAIERLIGELKNLRAEIEMKLCLGADSREASGPILRKAMQAGMIPSINSMMAVGMVFIPGMMTGQILSGADPLIAIKYQIVVMVMLTGSTAIGTLTAVLLVRKRCFNKAEQLVLRPD